MSTKKNQQQQQKSGEEDSQWQSLLQENKQLSLNRENFKSTFDDFNKVDAQEVHQDMQKYRDILENLDREEAEKFKQKQVNQEKDQRDLNDSQEFRNSTIFNGDEGEELKNEDEEPELDILSPDEESRINDEMEKEKVQKTHYVVRRLANSGLQGGVLYFPYFFYCWGFIPGLIILLGIFFLSQISSMLLLKCKNLSRYSNFTSISFSALSYHWEMFVRTLIILNRLMYSVVLLQIVAICIEQIICCFHTEFYTPQKVCLPNNYFLRSPFYVLCLGLLLIYPGIFLKKNPKNALIPSLRFLGIVVLFIQIVFVFISQGGISESAEMFPVNFSPQKAFTSVPSIIMIFNYHFKYFRFFKRLTNPCDKKMVIATVYGNFLIVLIYGGVGIFGYLTLGSNLSENKIILNYFGQPYIPYKSISTVLLSFQALVFLFQIPHLFYEAKFQLFQTIQLSQQMTLKLAKEANKKHHEIRSELWKKQQHQNNNFQKQSQTQTKYILIFSATWLTILIVSYFSINYLIINYIFIGGLTANFLSFFFPPLFYLRLSQIRSRYFIPAWLILIFSLLIFFLCILGLAMSIFQSFNQEKT